MPKPAATAPHETPGLQPFMQSKRVRAGRPDTQFFWIERVIDDQSHPCVAKQLSVELGPQVADLLEHERQVLRLLNAHHAPVCQWVEDSQHPDWLITRFAGLSLQLLGPGHERRWPALPLRERASVWASFLRRAQVLADVGAVPLDLADRNLVVPLGPSGQLDLSAAVSIDHAHTVLPGAKLAGGALRRPVWIGAKHNLQLAPEVRACLERDQQRFLDLLHQQGLPLPGTTPAVEDEAQVTHRQWLAYDAPQEVQKEVDAGVAIEAGKAIQYAVGHALHRHLSKDDPLTPALAAVVQRLCAHQASDRYDTLQDAANALKAAMGGVALSSAHVYQPRLPEDLRPSAAPLTAPLLDLNELTAQATVWPKEAASALGEGSTKMVEEVAAATPMPAPKPAPKPGPSPAPEPPPAPAPPPVSGTGAQGSAPMPPARAAAAGWRYAVAALLAGALGWPLGQWLATLAGA